MTNRKTAHHWTLDATQIMIQCVVEAYGACGSNKKGVHKAIAEKFNNAVQNNPNIAPIDERKIRNKYDSLRREWLKWDGLMNKTGSSWDPNKETVSGSDEWWEDCVQEFGPTILKYRRGPLENLEMMEQLFCGTHATGQSSYTPSANVQPSQIGTPPSTQSTFDRRHGENEDKMSHLIGIIHERQMKKSRMHFDSPNTGTSVESTGSSANSANMVARIQRLGEGGEFDIAEAILFVMEPDKKEVFIVLSDDIAKSWFISGLAAQRHTKEYQTFLMKQGGANKEEIKKLFSA